MPTISRYFIKTGLLYLVLALTIIVVQSLELVQLIDLPATIPYATYFHLLVMGWLTQLIFGVGIWMFPKYSKERPRGNMQLSWFVYVLLNVGLLMRLIAEPFMAEDSFLQWWMVLSAIFQTLAIYGFVWNSWGRIKER